MMTMMKQKLIWILKKSEQETGVVQYLLTKGEQGQCSDESIRLPPMWPRFKSQCRHNMWVEFVVGSLLCPTMFFSWYSGFPISSKTKISKAMFSLTFSSARWGSLRTGKAKNMHHRGCTFPGAAQGGSGVRDMTLPLIGNLGAKGTSLIFANLQAVAGGKKCCFRR